MSLGLARLVCARPTRAWPASASVVTAANSAIGADALRLIGPGEDW